jgi:2-C-methyl-D-erythritol 4-phosphate cytidylyltransferase
MHVFVIIPAAGLGTRMAAAAGARQAPKQFLELGGKPILALTVEAFLNVKAVDGILVAVRKSEIERVQSQLEAQIGAQKRPGTRANSSAQVSVVEGGDTRQESVRNALQQISAADDDIVLVHDAVRPLIDPATIERAIDEVARSGAAIVGLPAVDTIKQVERTANRAVIASTIPRERIVLAQTPQGFRFDLLKRAVEAAEADGFAGTDEASLVERLGVEVAVVPGSARNLKITQPDDLALAEFYLRQR